MVIIKFSFLFSMNKYQSFVILIPKSENLSYVTDFRLISLCNVYYKVISKILANCLKHVIDKPVGQEQNGFLSGHSAYDNIIVTQEVIQSFEINTSKIPRMIVKIDIEKAFDAIKWKAILATLQKKCPFLTVGILGFMHA